MYSSNTISGKLRNIFWPIYRHELGYFISMSSLMFCILLNQNILRIIKDSVLISEVSAEITSFAKVYCVTPLAAIFVVIYAKMSNKFSFYNIYLYLIIFFVASFSLFAWLVYPNVELLHMRTEKMQALAIEYPYLKWYIFLLGNWGYVLFYSLGELWPNIFYILLFWQLANQITTTEQAKRFYTLFSLFGNSSLMFVAVFIMYISSENSFINEYFSHIDSKIILVQASTLLVIISSIASVILVRYITQNIVVEEVILHDQTKTNHRKNTKLGLKESFKYILSSKYLWLLLICSASFGLTMNLVESVWKSKIKELYITVNSYAEFHALYIFWTGIGISIMTLIGNNIMRNSSWFVAAVITPIIIVITGVAFFALALFNDYSADLVKQIFFTSPLALAVYIGAIQNVIAKSTKYSIWDTSREMLYIPLDVELKTKGKAAVDIVSSKIGKSSSGLIQSFLFTIFPAATYTTITPFMLVIFVITGAIWIYAIKIIYSEYQKIL